MARVNSKPKQSAAAPLEETYLRWEVEQDLLHRLARIEGHVHGVRRMLEERKSCDELLVQLAAVRAALTQVACRLLEGHMETCVAVAVEEGEGDVALQSLRKALGTLLKSS